MFRLWLPCNLESEADIIAAQLDGAQLGAPALLHFELAQVCRLKSRLHSEQREALTAVFCLRSRLCVENAPADHDGVLDLANATGLTAYDAGYLWLARQLGAEPVTLIRTNFFGIHTPRRPSPNCVETCLVG